MHEVDAVPNARARHRDPAAEAARSSQAPVTGVAREIEGLAVPAKPFSQLRGLLVGEPFAPDPVVLGPRMDQLLEDATPCSKVLARVDAVQP